MADPILHVALEREWAAAQAVGVFEVSSLGKTLAEEGFIHCCYPDQLDGVFERYYSGVTEPLCVLVIDPDLLTAPLVAEDLIGAGENFPARLRPDPGRCRRRGPERLNSPLGDGA